MSETPQETSPKSSIARVRLLAQLTGREAEGEHRNAILSMDGYLGSWLRASVNVSRRAEAEVLRDHRLISEEGYEEMTTPIATDGAGRGFVSIM